MRKTFADLLTRKDVLLHPDCWNSARFPTEARVFNLGIRENLSLNFAFGLANAQTKLDPETKEKVGTIYIYGTCQFLLAQLFSTRYSYHGGKVVLINAGRIGYEGLGQAHNVDYDMAQCQLNLVQYHRAESNEEFIEIIEKIKKEDAGIFYVSLGADSPGTYNIK